MTTIKLPRRFATDPNYLAGADIGTPTKVDVGTPGSGFIRGAIAAPQNFNFEIDMLASAARRPLTAAALVMRPLDDAGSTPSDTTAALGVCSTGLEEVLLVKGGTNGAFRFSDFPLAGQSGITVAALVTDVRKLVRASGRVLAVGAGGNRNAFSTNGGNTWTAGGAPGTASLHDCVWDGTQFVVWASDEITYHSTNGVTWTPATIGSDTFNVLTGGTLNGLAVLAGGIVVGAGAIVDPAFAKSTNHGLTWTNTGGTVPNAHNFVAPRGWLAGNGGSEIYWLGNDGNGSSLKFFASADGAAWTLRANVGSGLTLAASTPKLLMCPDTGLLVGLLEQGFGGIVAMASLDGGRTWTERINTPVPSVHAFGLANGRLFATVGAKLFASDGIGAE